MIFRGRLLRYPPPSSIVWKNLDMPPGTTLFEDAKLQRFVIMGPGKELVAERPRALVNAWRDPGSTISHVARRAVRQHETKPAS